MWDKWNKIIQKGNDSDFEEVINAISKNKLSIIEKCLTEIVKVTGERNLEKASVPPFIIAWYPTHKEWPYQYYIPSPLLSNTPVGGIVVGAKKPIDEKNYFI